jgi:hypothetical protein
VSDKKPKVEKPKVEKPEEPMIVIRPTLDVKRLGSWALYGYRMGNALKICSSVGVVGVSRQQVQKIDHKADILNFVNSSAEGRNSVEIAKAVHFGIRSVQNYLTELVNEGSINRVQDAKDSRVILYVPKIVK